MTETPVIDLTSKIIYDLRKEGHAPQFLEMSPAAAAQYMTEVSCQERFICRTWPRGVTLLGLEVRPRPACAFINVFYTEEETRRLNSIQLRPERS